MKFIKEVGEFIGSKYILFPLALCALIGWAMYAGKTAIKAQNQALEEEFKLWVYVADSAWWDGRYSRPDNVQEQRAAISNQVARSFWATHHRK